MANRAVSNRFLQETKITAFITNQQKGGYRRDTGKHVYAETEINPGRGELKYPHCKSFSTKTP